MRDDQVDAFDTLGQARQKVREKWREGIECPCCGQLVKLYRRSINGAMCRFLIWLVRESEVPDMGPGRWINRADGPQIQNMRGGGDYNKLRHWGLIEHAPNEDNPALPKRSSGLWRPTVLGRSFVRNQIALPKYALVFDRKCFGFEGEEVRLRDCLPEWFDFWETWGYDLPKGD